LIALSFFHTYGTPIAVTRCGNLFGGGDLNFNRLIPGTIRSALADEAPIIRSNGRFVRDYFYVRDAVDAYLQLAERLPEEGFLGQAFNFGTETPVSVLDLVRMILTGMDKEWLSPVILNEANHEIPDQYLSCAKAHQALGWRPAYSLEQGLTETIAWYGQHLGDALLSDLHSQSITPSVLGV
jgi:CDP-glucose 4,6-dehydratase